MADHTDEAVCEQIGELIEQHLEHLRRDGPPVDLDALPSEIAAKAEPLLMVVDMLTDLGPPATPIEHDLVAIRLGITQPR